MKYNPQKIERKWQKVWEKTGIFKAKDFSRNPKKYILVEFPYPSGEGLHVGHCRSYIALDIVSRKRRMEGFNVLFPMGWDAFGLPTENYAIKTGIHPQEATQKNTSFFKSQQKSIGLSFDWSREINTTDPAYYKWTQWIFLQLFKKGLAYKAKMPINWCPACKIGLANEEVVEGKCERCGAKAERREKEQWMLKITKYAERLIRDLDKVDYPERVKVLQKDWIGKSEGWEIKFKIKNRASEGSEGGKEDKVFFDHEKLKTEPHTSGAKVKKRTKFSSPIKNEIDVFTTRIDTLFGATYLVLAPEHPIIEELKSEITNYKSVERYIKESKEKIERERVSEVKNKTGIEIKGIKAVNPVNLREIPVVVADYVLMHYGTGAIMAVPTHDQRDFDFAREYKLPMIEVIKPSKKKKELPKEAGVAVSKGHLEKAYEGEGYLVNSGRFNGLDSETAKERIGEWLKKKGLAKKTVHYKLRDWIFSRQRYWGEPIPMIKCQRCGWVAVPEKELPVKLPRVKKYQLTKTGESPLAAVEDWVNVKCPKCGGPAKRETDVMPNWAGSNWYYLRYCDSKNDKKLADPKLLRYWMPVDWYNGGMEHTTLHLLYSRFIYKFLWDIGTFPKIIGPEPYKKRTSHGMVLGEGGIKMSKSRGNVINPEQIIKQYGADTLRVYEMFMGPFGEAIAWDAKGVKGTKRFLQKVWGLFEDSQSSNPESKSSDSQIKKLLHKTIKKVSEDIENLKFNTAVSSLMEFCNARQENIQNGLREEDFKDFLKIFSPFAPHIAEELWWKLKAEKNLKNYKKSDSIFSQPWPKYDPKLVEEKKITLVIQINGRVRDKIEAEADIFEEKARDLALAQEKVKKWIGGKEIKKVIFVPGKLINIVT